jgi:hypothetical protein
MFGESLCWKLCGLFLGFLVLVNQLFVFLKINRLKPRPYHFGGCQHWHGQLGIFILKEGFQIRANKVDGISVGEQWPKVGHKWCQVYKWRYRKNCEICIVEKGIASAFMKEA